MYEADGLKFARGNNTIYNEGVQGIKHCGFEPKTVVDIGAYAGCLAIYAAAKFGAHCLAVEPVSFKDLYENCELNGVRNRIAILSAAVWNGVTIVGVNGDAGPCNAPGHNNFQWDSNIPFSTVKFTDLLQVFAGIDYLKIDTEGSEYNFLEPGCLDLLQDRVRWIDLELHAPLPAEAGHVHKFYKGLDRTQCQDRVFGLLKEAGFKREDKSEFSQPANRSCWSKA